MHSRHPVIALVLLAIGLLGDAKCNDTPPPDFGGGIIEDPDSRCASLSGESPPGLAFAPGDSDAPLWVADLSPSMLVPFEVDEAPPTVLDPPGTFLIPPDSDSDGFGDSPSPVLEGIGTFGTTGTFPETFTLVTATGYDEVLLFDPDPDVAALGRIDVSVDDALFVEDDYPFLPEPGTGSRSQTGLSAKACLRPPTGSLDSRGDALSIPTALRCDPAVADSFYASQVTGAAVINDRLFVSVANLWAGAGTADPQYLPGAVLVYRFTETAFGFEAEPETTIFLNRSNDPDDLETGYNPTHVTAYSVGARRFVLVTVTGSVGTVVAGRVPLTRGAIDVIDAATLELVATIPLGLSALAGGLAVSPDGSTGVTGSSFRRWLLAVDLTALATPPLPTVGPPIVLDGTDGNPNAIIHAATNAFVIPARTEGGAGSGCPGYTAGVAFNDAGTRVISSDFCDGTLGVTAMSLPAPASFAFERLLEITVAIDSEDATAPKGPGAVAVRPGRPNVSYRGSDVFVLIGQPGGLVCAIDVES